MGQPRSTPGTSAAPDTTKAQSLEEWCAYRWKNGVHGICPGFCLELHGDQQSVVTSAVREITRPMDGRRM